MSATDGPARNGPEDQEPLDELLGTVFDLADQIASKIPPGEVEARLRRTIQGATRPGDRTVKAAGTGREALAHRSVAVAPGMVLAGRFHPVRLLGQGAMGEVWQARDERLLRDVAVKVIYSTPSDPEALERFRLEVAAAARLQHPGIVQVHDAGWDGSQRYIVMELLAGNDLASVMQANPRGLPAGRAVDLGIQVAEALSAAHAAGIVHRDLKPSNLFVQEPPGSLKICDFGIARDFRTGAAVTKRGQTVGTTAYTAPELWQGVQASESSDLYSLGCVLYEMVTGHAPYEEEEALDPLYARHEIARDTIEFSRPVRTGNEDVPPALGALVLDLLAKTPAGRPSSAIEVARRLREVASSGGRQPRSLPRVPDVIQPREFDQLSLRDAATVIIRRKPEDAAVMLLRESPVRAARILDRCPHNDAARLIALISETHPQRAKQVLENTTAAKAGAILSAMDQHAAATILASMRPVDAADRLRQADTPKAGMVLASMTALKAAQIVEALDVNAAVGILVRMRPEACAGVLKALPEDRATLLLSRFTSASFRRSVQDA